VNLGELLRKSALSRPRALAASAPDGQMTFAELDAASDRVAASLAAAGVGPGDRVAVWFPKSLSALTAMQAALRRGAAYVPCDPLSPPARIRTILEDCRVRALVAPEDWGRSVLESMAATERPALISGAAGETPGAVAPVPVNADPESLAYILYTSGSTGRPKGVCLSHRAAWAFIRWAAEAIEASPADRFSSHAPFHFDLSVLDIYAAWAVGAPVVVIPEGLAYDARRLTDFIVEQGISVWYSVPSALMLMMDRGGLLEARLEALRAVLFAGEPFPIKHLRALREKLPRARLWNLYGPTETNVCTAYEVGEIAPGRLVPVPIGCAVCGDRVWAAGEDGREVEDGVEGELFVSGPTVMSGYWGREPNGGRPYATGDLVVRRGGVYEYVGRRDHMVKVRGYRIELGEIEAVLQSHPSFRAAAVVTRGAGLEARLVAFVSSVGPTPSLLEVKRFCAERLPRYMIVDELRVIDALPLSRNGKIDRSALGALASSAKAEAARVVEE
jgi:L-proline---[L-prolyl-carrier protein] ligase